MQAFVLRAYNKPNDTSPVFFVRSRHRFLLWTKSNLKRRRWRSWQCLYICGIFIAWQSFNLRLWRAVFTDWFLKQFLSPCSESCLILRQCCLRPQRSQASNTDFKPCFGFSDSFDYFVYYRWWDIQSLRQSACLRCSFYTQPYNWLIWQLN